MDLYISVGLAVVHVNHSDLRIVVLLVTGIQTTMENNRRFMIHRIQKMAIKTAKQVKSSIRAPVQHFCSVAEGDKEKENRTNERHDLKRRALY
jgi:hypothetical protein